MSINVNFDRREKSKLQKNPDAPEQQPDENEKFIRAARVRNLCFVQPDGKKVFLNYSYLVSGEYLASENVIKLSFTTHQVEISGYNLSGLFELLLAHVAKKIVAEETRYAPLKNDGSQIVTHINIIAV
jgi:hypothetical protein